MYFVDLVLRMTEVDEWEQQWYSEVVLFQMNGFEQSFWKNDEENLALLNARPRKLIGFKSPMELFEYEI